MFKLRDLVLTVIFVYLASARLYSVERIGLIVDPDAGPATRYALNRLETLTEKFEIETATTIEELEASKVVLAGHRAWPVLHDILSAKNIVIPKKPESLVIRQLSWQDKQVVLVTGSDDTGVMYGVLDVAERISWAKKDQNVFDPIIDTTESPFTPERALSIYTMHRELWEQHFYDKQYWTRLLDMLATNRFNSFVLICGYSPATFLAPAYPYFYDVDGFPEVRFENLTDEQQQRNLDMLNQIIQMAHERGMRFTLGLWDHIPRDRLEVNYTTPVGLSRDNLIPYTRAALTKLLQVVPELDGIQFRMHWESGLTRDEDELESFWGSVFRMIKQSGRDIRIDTRAKGMPDFIIDEALNVGIDLRVTTKYWAEQLGLPFHPTHINKKNQLDRRHGYADLLSYPPKYKIHWKLWNAGTNKLFLWGDPDYVRRFANSTHLYEGDGFEVNMMGATKMAMHPEEQPFELLNPSFQYYTYEFERYWHFLQLFGRLGYNPDTPAEVWHQSFKNRFGHAAAPFIEMALHRASQVLPRIIGYAMHHFPTLSGFPEMDCGGELDHFSGILPSDIRLFISMQQAADHLLSGRESAKIWPQQTADWFDRTSTDILNLVKNAESRIGENQSPEFRSTCIDLQLLAYMASYHSHRIPAAVNWLLYEKTHDLFSLEQAINREAEAIEVYEKITKIANGVYADDLMMGRYKSPHWRDELELLKNGFEDLQKQRRDYSYNLDHKHQVIAHIPVRKHLMGTDLYIRATLPENLAPNTVQILYDDGTDGYKSLDLKSNGSYKYTAHIPAKQIRGDIRYYIKARAGSNNVYTWPPQGPDDPIHVTVTHDTKPPVLLHQPVEQAKANEPLMLTVTVQDANPVKWVRVYYRSVTQFQDYQKLEMKPVENSDTYRAVIPAEHLDPKWDFMYFFEVMDVNQNGKIYPDMEMTSPYVVVRLKR